MWGPSESSLRLKGRCAERWGDPERAAARQMIEATVAAAFGLPIAELSAATRRRAKVAFARQVGMYVAHVVLGLSLTETGNLFERDRTTAAHACRVVEDRRDDNELDRMLDAIETVVIAWKATLDCFRADQDTASEGLA